MEGGRKSLSTTIDNRIVEMQFDNQDFERNVKTSLSTLKTLNSSLDGLNSANALKGLDKAGNIDLSALERSIETVNSRFSTMGIIGMAALQSITDMAVKAGAKLVSSLIDPIKTGGFNRALNLENAKFQLEGLLKSGEAVAEVMKDVDYGVKDTAYSLDAAAKVAAQLTASGIRAGEAMQKSLRGISGVASMTNSTYEDIGSIFTTVAGQGKLMTMQLRQLEARGLNAAAIMGEQLGKTEAEIRDMVTKGQVNFKMFASAMDDAFGEHAKDANKTFTGAMSNMRAALARTGAMFAGPYLTNMRDVFNAIRLSVNALNKELTPIADTAERVMVRLRTVFVDALLDPISGNVRDEVVNIIRSLVSAFDNLNKVTGTVGTAFKSIFTGITANHVESFALGVEALSSKLLDFANTAAPHITMAFRGLFYIFSEIGKGIGLVTKGLSPFIKLAGETILFFIKLAGALGEYVVVLGQSLKANQTFIDIVNKLKSVVGPAFEFVKNAIDKVIESMRNFSGLADLKLPGINGLENFSILEPINALATGIKRAFDTLKTVVSSVAPVVGAAFEFLGRTFGTLAEGFVNLFAAFKFNNATFDLSALAVIGATFWTFAGVLKRSFELIKFLFNDIKAVFSRFIPKVAMPILTPLRTLKKIPSTLNSLLGTLTTTLHQFTVQIKAESLIKIATAVGILAASLLVISSIPTEKLTASIGAIGGLMAELMASFKVFSNMNPISASGKGGIFAGLTNALGGLSAAANLAVLAAQMITFSAAILILAGALKAVSSIPIDKMAASIAILGGMIAGLTIALNYMSNHSSKLAVTSASMLAFAASISVLAGALKKIAEIDTNKLLGAGAALAGIMAAMVISFRYLSKIENKLAITAASMIAFALSISILTSAIKKLSTVDMDFDLFIGFGAIIAGLVGGLSILSHYSQKLAITSVAMLSFAASVLILSSAFKKIASVENPNAIEGFVAVVVGMVASFVILTKLEGKLAVTSASMIAFSAAILILSSAMKKIGTIGNIDSAIEGFAVALVGMVAVFAAMDRYVTKLPVTAKAMLAFAAAVLVLSAAMRTISGMQDVNTGLLGFAVAVGGMAAAFALLSTYATTLPVISGSMIAFAAAVLVLSLAIKTLGSSTGDVIAGSLALLVLTAGLVALAYVLPPLTPALLLFSAAVIALGAGFIALAVGLGMLTSIGSAGLNVLLDTLMVVVDRLPEFVIHFMAAFDVLLAEIVARVPIIVDAVLTILIDIIQGFADKTPALSTAASNLILAIIQGITENLPRLVDSGMKLIISFMDSMSDALNNNQDRLINAMERFIETLITVSIKAVSGFLKVGVNIISKILSGLARVGGDIAKKLVGLMLDAIGKLFGLDKETIEAGKRVIYGIIDGIVEMSQKLIGVVKDVANLILDGIKRVLGISSSSSSEAEDIGRYLCEGMADGITNNSDTVVETAKSVGEEASDVMSGAVKDGIEETVNEIDRAADTINAKVAKMRMAQGKVGFEGSTRAQKIDSLFGEDSQGLDKVTIKETTDNLGTLNTAMKEVKATSGEMQENLGMTVPTLWDIGAGASNASDNTSLLGGALGDVQINGQGLPDVLNATAGGLTEIVGGAGEATGALNDLSWGGVDPTAAAFTELAQKIDEQIDIFNKFTKNTGVSGTEMINNMRSQVDGVREWAQNLKDLAEDGIEHGLLEELAKLGPQGYETVAAFKDMTTDQLAEANELWKQQLTLDDEAAAIIKEAFESAAKGGVDAYKATIEAEKETVRWSATSMGQDTSNMVADALYEGRGNVETAAQSLSSGAVNSYTAALDAEQARIRQHANALGNETVDGITEGQEQSKDQAFESMRLIAEGIESAYGTQMGIRSPSTVMKTAGEQTIQGLVNGIKYSSSSQLTPTITQVVSKMVQEFSNGARKIVAGFTNAYRVSVNSISSAIRSGFNTAKQTAINGMRETITAVKNTANSTVSSSNFDAVGKTIVDNIASGIITNQAARTNITQCISNIHSAAKSAVASYDFKSIGTSMADGIASGIASSNAIQNAARQAVRNAKAAAMAEAQINSPSKLFMRDVGEPIAEGIAKGITDNENLPVNAAKSLIDVISDSMRQIDDILNGNIDLNPVITPTLDLSYINSGISAINSSFERSNALKLQGNVEDVNGVNGGGNNYTYNQYNYSPKSLSRLDIYRDTKNLLSAARG